MSFDLERLRASLLLEPLAGDFVQEAGGEDLPLTSAAVHLMYLCLKLAKA
jgi:hypothetical protein